MKTYTNNSAPNTIINCEVELLDSFRSRHSLNRLILHFVAEDSEGSLHFVAKDSEDCFILITYCLVNN